MDELLKDETAGDPITGLQWTKKTSHTISRALKRQGYQVGADTVRRLLKKGKYVLRANRKRVNKRKDPSRDRQMRYLVRKRKQHENVLVRNRANTNSDALGNFALKSPFVWFTIT